MITKTALLINKRLLIVNICNLFQIHVFFLQINIYQ